MKTSLRFAILAGGVCLLSGILPGGNPKEPALRLIDRFHECVVSRFADPAPEALGMSRVAAPPSFGTHFRPNTAMTRDFVPITPQERDAIGALERRQVQAGLYVFGAAIGTAGAEKMDYRALKGPAALTRGTPRPAWYPPMTKIGAGGGDALPDWQAVYPLARRAMRSFQAGGKGFETSLDSWTVAVRPLAASHERCVACHNNQVYGRGARIRPGESIGGAIYAFR